MKFHSFVCNNLDRTLVGEEHQVMMKGGKTFSSTLFSSKASNTLFSLKFLSHQTYHLDIPSCFLKLLVQHNEVWYENQKTSLITVKKREEK